MNILTTLITGGFLKGYRTYLLGALIAAQAVVSWLIGDLTLPALLEQLPEILGGLGLNALRAGVASETVRAAAARTET
jgi:hypothetical protein